MVKWSKECYLTVLGVSEWRLLLGADGRPGGESRRSATLGSIIDRNSYGDLMHPIGRSRGGSSGLGYFLGSPNGVITFALAMFPNVLLGSTWGRRG